MEKTKLRKSTNDFIIGLALLAVGIFILFTDQVVQGTVTTGNGGILVRPDVYVRLVGGCLAFFAAILALKAINWKRSRDARGFTFVISREVVLTIVLLVAYVFFLEIIHFFAATFLLAFLLTIMFFRKETSATETEKPAKIVALRRLVAAAAYSAMLTVAVYLVFEDVLKVTLP